LMKGPTREISPLGEQAIVLQMPPGFSPRRVSTLVTRKDLPFKRRASEITFTLPSVNEYEVAVVTS